VLLRCTSHHDKPVSSQQYWANQLEPHQYVSVPELAARFKGSRVGRAIQERLAMPAPSTHVTARFHTGHSVRCATTLLDVWYRYDSIHCHNHVGGRFALQELVSKEHRYALTPQQLFFACWRRENVLVSRNMFQYGFRFFITVVMVRHAKEVSHLSSVLNEAL